MCQLHVGMNSDKKAGPGLTKRGTIVAKCTTRECKCTTGSLGVQGVNYATLSLPSITVAPHYNEDPVITNNI